MGAGTVNGPFFFYVFQMLNERREVRSTWYISFNLSPVHRRQVAISQEEYGKMNHGFKGTDVYINRMEGIG